jgi:hypothetical protein
MREKENLLQFHVKKVCVVQYSFKINVLLI